MPGKKSAIYGEVVTFRGDGRPVTIDRVPRSREVAGYAPEELDSVIRTLIRNVESGAELLNTYTPMLEALMQRLAHELGVLLEAIPPTVRLATETGEPIPQQISGGVLIALELANKVSIVLERVNKMTMQAVRSKDDASRLRAYLAGDVQPTSLDHKGENELRRMIVDASTGFKDPNAV